MKTTVINSITTKRSNNFENNIRKLLPKGIEEIYLSSCGMKRIGTGSYNYFLEIQINNQDYLTLYSHTNCSPVWDEWQDIEAGSYKHDLFNKRTALMLLQFQGNVERIINVLGGERN